MIYCSSISAVVPWYCLIMLFEMFNAELDSKFRNVE